MNNLQENKFTMYEGVLGYLNEHSDIIGSAPAFGGMVARLQELILLIRQKETEKKTMTAGKTETKENAKTKLLKALLPVMSALKIHSVSTQDAELRARVKATPSQLGRMRDTELVSLTGDILNLAQTHLAALSVYNIKADQINEVKAKLDSYQTALATRESAAAKKTTATGTLPGLFNETDALLRDQLDEMVNILKDVHPDFYAAYQNARDVKNLGKRYRKAEPEATPA